ncbi:MAG: T9SS type A sorting domain-containing protein [Bacteroidales bacterium]|nr:T9SS type A sorting domain-containing protein [Bacteroidales bacterium]
MKHRTLLFLMFFISPVAGAQGPVGSWQDHLSYLSALSVAAGNREVYASAGGALLIYNREFDELRKVSKVHGLSETGISAVGWSEETSSLIIAYQSANLDIMSGKDIYNVPDIKMKYIPGRKEIYRIRCREKYAYLAGTMGLVVLDINKKVIRDTWKPGDLTYEIFDVVFAGNLVYAATSGGLWYAESSDPGLSYPGSWTRVDIFPNPSAAFNSVTVVNGMVYANRNVDSYGQDTIFVLQNPQQGSLFSTSMNIHNLSLDSFNGGFTVTSPDIIRIYNQSGALVRTIDSYSGSPVDVCHAVYDGKDLWIADRSSGLIRAVNGNEYIRLALPGPITSNVHNISTSGGKAFIAAGGVDNAWNNLWRPLQVFTSDNNLWISDMRQDLHDAMRILPDPADKNHFWVSTWGAGLLEYENNQFARKYDASNSPLETIIPGKPYSRVCGLAMDRNRNIWITQTGVPGSVKVLKPDRTWISFPFTIEAPTIGDIIVTSSGQKWIILPRGYGLFVFDDNGTIDNFGDDRFRKMLVKDTDNKVTAYVYSIAEDLDGNIWVGTDQGPAVYYNTSRIFEEEPVAFRIKVPRNDGTGLADYMLGTEIISSIAVDGANRKWLGTFNSGVYLLSADGTTKIRNYNEENSPLFSNTIASLSVDGSTGTVWIGTSKGVISVRGDATTGKESFGNIYAFPNPVRETYNGVLTVTGLMRNSSVRITDISGNLVYRCTSDGGQATWDLLNYRGERVSTGVYLIFVASEDGSQAAVTKVLIVK